VVAIASYRGTLSVAAGTSAIAGLFFGALDALLTLRNEPYPGSGAFLLAYAIGPILVGVAWGCTVGVVAAVVRCARSRREESAIRSTAVAAVGATWMTGAMLVAVREGHSLGVWALISLAAGLFAVAFARLARDVAVWVDARSASHRRLYWGIIMVVLAVASAATAPSGLASFRGGTGPCAAGDAPIPRSPNVLLISVDTLRADVAREMTSYQRLAARGIDLTQHLTLSPWTLPSVASMLTGLPLAEHGAGVALSSRTLLKRTAIGPELRTIAERLGANGYRTHAIVTNPFLTASYGADRGFCTFENVTIAAESVRGLGHTTPIRFLRVLAPRLLPDDRAKTVGRKGEAWIAQGHGRPFFLWLHFLDPHAPYGDRDGVPTSLTFDLMAMQRNQGLEVPFRDLGALRAGEYRPGIEERRRIAELYREDVFFVDEALARLLDLLDESGMWAETAVVLTSDHGEEFWDHGGVEHGRTLYEEVLRVPLVIAAPGTEGAPRTEDSMTSVLDLVPTILAFAGISDPELPGRNLLEVQSTGDTADHLILGGLLFGQGWQGIRTPLLKYLRSEHGEERLFDLAEDPGERIDQAGRMQEELARLRSQLPDFEPRATKGSSGRSLSDAERRALRNLGYLR
jgi:arylsulfatase A-like enzyme